MPAVAVPITLTTNIADVPGVGARRANAFRKIGIRGVADLLLHMPMRYERQIGAGTIAEASDAIGPLHKSDALVSLQGEVASARAPLGRRKPFEATLFDGSGTVKLTWFNSPWMKGKLHPGARIRVTGKMQRHGDYLQMVNPKWEPLKSDGVPAPSRQPSPSATRRDTDDRGRPREREIADTSDGKLIPVYHATDSLPSPVIHDAVEAILDQATAQLDDHLPDDYRKRSNLPSLGEAYRMVHRPADEDEIKLGRRRLAFDELLLLELG